jgi:hypothetical protein
MDRLSVPSRSARLQANLRNTEADAREGDSDVPDDPSRSDACAKADTPGRAAADLQSKSREFMRRPGYFK